MTIPLAVPIFAILTLLSYAVLVTKGHPRTSPHVNQQPELSLSHFSQHLNKNLRLLDRSKRTSDLSDHIIKDCIFMTSDEGDFYYKASFVDGNPCGIYIFSEPDQNIEIHFNYLDVPCDNKGLVAFVDGWELNGELFPSAGDHQLALQTRFFEFCDERKLKKVFRSSQNVALIQHRMPAKGAGFSFSVRFVRNPTPCNVLFQSTDDIFTLRNYGKRSNCSVSTLFPAVVRPLALNVGVRPFLGAGFELETGTVHKCQKRGLNDFVQVGGSNGLDNANLLLAESICGLDSKPGKHEDLIACGTTTVRLVSSGAFENAVTVAIRKLTEEDLNNSLNVVCEAEELVE